MNRKLQLINNKLTKDTMIKKDKLQTHDLFTKDSSVQLT